MQNKDRVPILVADDDSTTRTMLETLLVTWGYEPRLYSDGASAWFALQQPGAPRLAVLDWMMPGMDGVDVIRAMRKDEQLRYTYVLLLTGREGKSSLVEGLQSGADDFILKPCDANELKSRIAVGARLVQVEDELHQYAQNMEALATQRAAQLVHADRLSSLGVMAAGIAHEINNPCTVISSNMQLLKRLWGKIENALPYMETHADEAGISRSQLRFCREEMPGIIQSSLNGVKRISQMVKSLKTYSHKEGSGFQACDLNACILQALELCAGPIKKKVCVEQDLAEALPAFYGDTQKMEQVIVNLVINAADALEGTEKAILKISTCCSGEGHIEARIEDNGPGIPTDAAPLLFAPFYTTKPLGKGTGLGLSICQSIMESFGGTITVENVPQGGACFLLRLPTNSI